MDLIPLLSHILKLQITMGALLSTPSPQQPDAPIKPNQECRGLFNRRNGDNIPECLHPPSPSQYVTVFFNWTDRMHNDEQLMALVAARIKARDGIITPEPVHHDLRWCMSLRVPKHHEATDVSIADCAKCVADWIRQQIIYQGVNIDRDYLFRSSHLPAWKG
ncbi:unnamed protein product [Penicillium olsonii]|uniref:Uncharacterized protein n=1 Tax=Penicillium olsonii TaxID=99116 RepID=A0A9W4HTS9_PENOL|nr:unnamed protein product [Penicillium olsonii]CAG7929706.1 unnamed protein product [Penicillium olsonii]CAG8135539.1 unnamed protein product [Penicillium olsonii]CAG8154442.1 unnamed protein product [Penicillium olsonii]